jgi:hypothetical protein
MSNNPAKAAYEAYCDAVGGVSVTGETLPQWVAVRPTVKAGWTAAALAACRPPDNLFTDREQKEIQYCVMYMDDFNHGTDGHNMRIIIAKLWRFLNPYAEEESCQSNR